MVSQFVFGYTFYSVLGVLTTFYVIKLISNFFYNTKKFFYRKKESLTILILSNPEIQYILLTQIFLINSFKTLENFWNKSFNIVFLLGFFFLVLSYVFILLTKKTNYFDHQLTLLYNLSIWFYTVIVFLFLVDNFILLLLLLEFLSLIYYFFFLEQTFNSQRSFIKLKNLLNAYLWLNWFTLIFFFLSLLKISIEVGTLNFSEIMLLESHISKTSWFLLFLAVFFKLGISGFHILKFQVYQYISFFFLIPFSMYTFFLNSVIFLFLFLKLYHIFFFYQEFILHIVLSFNFILLLGSFRVYSFSQFLAVSTINVWTLMVTTLCL